MMSVEPGEGGLATALESQSPGAEWKFKGYPVW